MCKKLIIAMVLLIACTPAYAANLYSLAENVVNTGIAPVVLVQRDDTAFTCCVGISDNTTTMVIVEIDGSIMTSVWSEMVTITANSGNITNNNGNCATVTMQPVTWLRAHIQTIQGGTTPKVTVRCKGMGYYK